MGLIESFNVLMAFNYLIPATINIHSKFLIYEIEITKLFKRDNILIA